MKSTLFFFFLSVGAFYSAANAQVLQQWVARDHGPADQAAMGNAIAVDAAGNVYITGTAGYPTTSYDYYTVKYDRAGNMYWAQNYDGPGTGANGKDFGKAIAVDRSGNVYVTGWSGDTNGTVGATIKYDRNGGQKWVAQYDSGRTTLVAVDDGGNVYVAGVYYYSNHFLLIKYNSNGAVQWSKVSDGSGSVASLALDKSGNIYIGGSSNVNGSAEDYATIKYNPSGVEQWSARYDGSAHASDISTSLAVDDAGNVYVTGSSVGVGTATDYATVKYNSAGVEQWAMRYNGPADSSDAAKAVRVDGAGDVYVTGSSVGTVTRNEIATIKYSSTGTEQWVKRYTNSDSGAYPVSLAVDRAGNVYVLGYGSGDGTYFDYITMKYESATGAQQWTMRYDGPSSGFDIPNALAIDTSGNAYVTGYSYDQTGMGIATVKYGVSASDVSESSINSSSGEIKLYPHPLINASTFMIHSSSAIKNAEVKIYDALSREVKTVNNINANQFVVERGTFQSGIFFYCVKNDGVLIGSGKIIVE